MKKFTKLVATASIFTVMMSTMATGTFAADIGGSSEVNTTITAGDKKITAPTGFTFTANLDGRVQTETTSLGTLTVKDATGSGGGWTVYVSADKLSTATGKKLAKSTIEISGTPTIKNLDNLSTDGFTVKSGDITGTTPLALVTAASNKGMGTFEFAFGTDSLQLTLSPDETYVGEAYSTIVNWDFTAALQ
ncbi:WxL domain-containing protein [Bacillus sp. JJ1533]|uniref:WxL domain-containing protein n=1 Tax=Bacillus sp. JJ1533 TaxID=3122959 RepID=UPI003000A5AE